MDANLRELLLYSSILLFAIALIFFIISTRQKRKAGIPAGRVIYSDTRRWAKVEKALYDPDLRLTGKPDYLIEQGGTVIPIEVKSGRTPPAPYDAHLFQLAAYCLLAWHEYGARPAFGIINYPKKTFQIDFTPALETATREIVSEMQERASRAQVQRSHQDPQRCSHCGYQSICDQSLRI